MARLHTVYIKIHTIFIFSEVLKYLIKYIGFVLLIKLIVSVGMLVYVLNLSSVCREGTSHKILYCMLV